MEIEVLNERTEWEARRVMAAFEGLIWQRRIQGEILLLHGIGYKDVEVFVDIRDAEWHRIDIFSLLLDRGEFCDASPQAWRVRQNEVTGDYDPTGTWHYYASACYYPSPYCGDCNELMARGMYRLGVEGEEVLAEINYPLTAHEKMELRLVMPREFWPQKWLDEEER